MKAHQAADDGRQATSSRRSLARPRHPPLQSAGAAAVAAAAAPTEHCRPRGTHPVPSVCSMCCLSVRPLVPTGTFFTERKVPPFLQG